jgi:hypothetical protein
MYSNKSPVVRHIVYFFPDGDVIIKVDETIFRIHKHFLTRESNHFRSMFMPSIPCRDPPGSSETNPVVLDDAKSEGFADLLWVFYNPKFSIYSGTVDKWKRILTLAQQWRFVEVEQLCVRELEKLPIPPVEKIQIYQDFKLNPDLLHKSYVALTVRDEPLDLEEGEQLGLPTSLKVARARELARFPDGLPPAQLQESEVESAIKAVFGLQGSAPAPATAPPQPTPGAELNHVDKATVKNRKNNKA